MNELMKFKVYEGGLYGTLTENKFELIKAILEMPGNLETYYKSDIEIRDENLIYFYENLLEELEEFKAQGHAYVDATMWSTDKIDFDFYPNKQLPVNETIRDIQNKLNKLRLYD